MVQNEARRVKVAMKGEGKKKELWELKENECLSKLSSYIF